MHTRTNTLTHTRAHAHSPPVRKVGTSIHCVDVCEDCRVVRHCAQLALDTPKARGCSVPNESAAPIAMHHQGAKSKSHMQRDARAEERGPGRVNV
jgi:hypothetical protein